MGFGLDVVEERLEGNELRRELARSVTPPMEEDVALHNMEDSENGAGLGNYTTSDKALVARPQEPIEFSIEADEPDFGDKLSPYAPCIKTRFCTDPGLKCAQ